MSHQSQARLQSLCLSPAQLSTSTTGDRLPRLIKTAYNKDDTLKILIYLVDKLMFYRVTAIEHI